MMDVEIERLRALLVDFIETLTIGRVTTEDWYPIRDRALAQAREILAVIES